MTKPSKKARATADQSHGDLNLLISSPLPAPRPLQEALALKQSKVPRLANRAMSCYCFGRLKCTHVYGPQILGLPKIGGV
jgi:hypothetical protein